MKSSGKILSSVGAAEQKLNNLQLVFPEEGIKKGSTWKTKLPANPQIPAPLVMTYKALGISEYRGRRCMKIATFIKSTDENEMEDLSLELDAKGRIFFDIEAGQMISNRVNSDMRMVIKRLVGNQMTSIITRMEMKVRLELQEQEK